MNTIFLDYQASTPLHPAVLEVMLPYLTTFYANPHSSDHILGWQSHQAIQSARGQIAQAINADSDEIVFTSGATEANNLAIQGLKRSLESSGKTTIVTSAIEHKCVLSCFAYLEQEGFTVIELPPNPEGIIDPSSLQSLNHKNIGLVSIMLVNNEIGTIQPIKELAEIAHSKGAIFHTDAAQAPVFLPIDVQDNCVDLLSLSGHKFYGPKGVGALFIKRDVRPQLNPIMHGGGQEDGLRSGTLPTALCVGFGEAITLITRDMTKNRLALSELSYGFFKTLSHQLSDITINGSSTQRHPGNLNIHFPDFDARDLLQSLQPNIAASTGSACSTGVEEPSYVLTALGLSTTEASESIRFSFGIDQTKDIIKEAATFISAKVLERRELMSL